MDEIPTILTKEKEKKTQILKIRYKTSNATTDPSVIKRIIREY